MACLLYGAGLRVMERCRLRVQDVDFGTNQIVVRGGKGGSRRFGGRGRNKIGTTG